MAPAGYDRNLENTLNKLRSSFREGTTRPLSWRMKQLEALKTFLVERNEELNAALWQDLRKSSHEAAVTEQGLVIAEIDDALEHLAEWMKTEKVAIPLINQPGYCEIRREPFGLTLIIGAWNYPVNLIPAPLVGAIAGGNVAVIKPSEIAAATSSVLARYLPEYLDPNCIAVMEGGVEETQAILAQPFDFIFYTGSSRVGKIVMTKAAVHLTPVFLELGGKSPTIVLDDKELGVTARRITWGKFINAGQTCIAPDYVLALPHLVQPLIAAIKGAIKEFYGEDAEQSPDYCRVVNDKNFERLSRFLGDGKLEIGGKTNPKERYIAPTVLSHVSPESPIMQEEIFGPLLPILPIANVEEAIQFVNLRPKPLALYIFSGDKPAVEKVLAETSSGGVCINDVVMHMPVPELPFGGVGASGMGSYHGRRSFESFTHAKGILIKGRWPDFAIRYPPYVDSQAKLAKIL
ncbi:MAG TPA: aldehyde dehydrogenase family protein [Oligoflexus sp.]|uniref:aldehyde dehydrogenase family protein n=1 Tax=Oligoflexus sp. TaxID=1971216 RepID=UPI002D591B8F|nr:aldehyde dehydrogenase family protein [Oligoflexus sp.]HYX37760.1 aldehyde dehydrogenase family protein [Oligoflexus sp.]